MSEHGTDTRWTLIRNTIWYWFYRHELLVDRCAECGRWRLHRQLSWQFVPDTHFTAEEKGYYCRRCR